MPLFNRRSKPEQIVGEMADGPGAAQPVFSVEDELRVTAMQGRGLRECALSVGADEIRGRIPEQRIPPASALRIPSLRHKLAVQCPISAPSAPEWPSSAPPTERAEHVLAELTAVLEWFFDDGLEDAYDAQLATLANAGEPTTLAELASALEGYAAVAREVKDRIHGVVGFDAAMVDEAPALAKQLRERGVPVDPSAQATALDLRRRLATMLLQRMQLVRAGARIVFRHHPAIAREVTSPYERRRRSTAKRKAALAEAETAATLPDAAGGFSAAP